MSSFAFLTPLQRKVLCVLGQGGTAIWDGQLHVRDDRGMCCFTIGNARTAERLRQARLVTRDEIELSNGTTGVIYRLTEIGRHQFELWATTKGLVIE